MSLLIFLCDKGLYPEIIIFVYILIRQEGGDLDLIDCQLQILTHQQIYCAFIYIF